MKLTIPNDLQHNHVALFGTGMFSGQASTQISPDIETDARNNRIVQFRACYQEFSLGPSPQGRLEIMTIRTPIARRDTKPLKFEVFQDMRYEKLIAAVARPGYVIKAKDLAPGKITIESVTPADMGVQLFTDITIKFSTEHQMYVPAHITVEYPSTINLPPTGSSV